MAVIVCCISVLRATGSSNPLATSSKHLSSRFDNTESPYFVTRSLEGHGLRELHERLCNEVIEHLGQVNAVQNAPFL